MVLHSGDISPPEAGESGLAPDGNLVGRCFYLPGSLSRFCDPPSPLICSQRLLATGVCRALPGSKGESALGGSSGLAQHVQQTLCPGQRLGSRTRSSFQAAAGPWVSRWPLWAGPVVWPQWGLGLCSYDH